MSENEIAANQDGLFLFVSFVSFVLFIALLVKAFEKGKNRDIGGVATALFFAFIVLLMAIMTNYAIQKPSMRLVKFSLSFNSNEFKEAINRYWGYGKIVVIFIAFYYLIKFFYLYRLSKNSSKMFARYSSIIETYYIKGKPVKDHKVKIFAIEPELINPLDPELWGKNVAQYFTEREEIKQ
jgi:hypothetical protein